MKNIVTMFTLVFFLSSFFIAEEKKAKPEFPAVDPYIKGMTNISGFFSMYKKDEKLYSLIPSSKFKKPFLIAMTISSGVYGGMQWDHMMVYWQKQGKKLLLMRPDLRYKAGKTTMASVVKRTYPATIIRAIPIMAKKGSSYLINMAAIFKSDIAGLTAVAPFLLGGQLYLNGPLSSWTKVKAFPTNIELGVSFAFTGTKMLDAENFTDETDLARSYKLGVHFSIASIPSSNYKPRIADTRIGYFGVAIKDFSKKYSARNKFQRYINRWHLEKIDPSLEISPPKKPIIFYIEKTVPYKYRKYVKEAISEWNKAFEKVGIIDAIVVRQQTQTQFANLDPEDARYNFFRWTTNEMGFAAGPSRVNPVTGEIIDADIIFDDSMLRYASHAHTANNNAMSFMQNDDLFMKLCEKLGKRNPFKRLQHFLSAKDKKKIKNNRELLKVIKKRGIPVCAQGQHKRQQLNFAHMMMKAKGKKELSLEFIGEYLKEVIMHEVGHTLGLYHNFKGSSWLPLSKINSKEKPAAISGSVMDYNPINFAPKGTPQGHYLTTTLGPYDYWAIEYGYKSIKGAEKKTLAKIAERCAEDGLAYANDLYAASINADPFIFRWDLGNDHIEYAKQSMKLMEQLQKDMLKRYVDKGEDFHPIRKAFSQMLRTYTFNCLLVARYVGGQHVRWDHKGDPNARTPLQVVSAKKQKEALQFLNDTMFASRNFSPEILNHLSPGTWWHWGTTELDPAITYPLHDMIVSYQAIILFTMLNPVALMRLHNSPLQVKDGEEVFTIADLLDGLTSGIWKELDTRKENNKSSKYSNSKPFISSFRRNLQRTFLDFWMYYLVEDDIFYALPADAKSIALKNLRTLLSKFENTLKNKDTLDSASLAHIMECKHRILILIEE